MDVISLAKINELKKSGGVGYEETKWVEALPETTVEVTFVEEEGIAIATFPFIQAEEGSKVKVVFNGVTYDTEYRSATVDEQTYMGIGNLGFAGLEDTGEPFLIIPNDGGKDGYESYSMLVCEEGTHTISVSVEQTTVHKVDPKFTVPQGYELVDFVRFAMPTVGGTSEVPSLDGAFGKIIAIYERGLIPICHFELLNKDVYGIPLSYATNSLGNVCIFFNMYVPKEEQGEITLFQYAFSLYCSDGKYYVKR